MAVVKLSALLADMRGSIAGTNFSLSRSTLTASRKNNGRRRRTANQSPRSAQFARLITRWKDTLSTSQRARWAEFTAGLAASSTARKTLTLTAINVYLRENLARARAGIPLMDDPPPVPRILATPNIISDFQVSSFYRIFSTGDLPGAGQWFIVNISIPHSAAANNPRIWSRQTSLLTGPIVITTSILINAPRFAGQARTAWTRLVSNAGLMSVPHVFTDVL